MSLGELKDLQDFTLVVCEKPDAARRVAEAIAEGKPRTLDVAGVTLHLAQNEGVTFVVVSALGHLYTVADPSRNRKVYPVFDVEWFPTHLVERKVRGVASRLKLFRELAKRASRFIHACDFDLEGETIGFNILRYACGGREAEALRAKFSTLTREELMEAFRNLKPALGLKLAEAGRTRHIVDFVWGVNLSRALSEAFYAANGRYQMVSVGRVQSPTLAYVVDREVEIRCFVPTPYWVVSATMEKEGLRLVADYDQDRVPRLAEALAVKGACEGQEGVVDQVSRRLVKLAPPTPFDIGDLQREAYRAFGFSPSLTLRIAERLYLDALISYPRTSSQKLPPSIDYPKILRGLGRLEPYRQAVQELLAGPLKPREGAKDDPAHPAIYPTGEVPQRELDSRESKLYDLIVRRFFAVFGEEAHQERVRAHILVEGYGFKLAGRRTVKEGWLRYYGLYSGVEEAPIPPLEEGDSLQVVSIDVLEKFERPPPRYNQSSLLQRMEEEGIGTKTTRADIIRTLYDRGYVVGESMEVTDMGFKVVELMKRHSSIIVSTEMTRAIERDLEAIEQGAIRSEDVVERAILSLAEALPQIKGLEVEIGREIRKAVISTVRAQNLLGPCPVCGTGNLTIIRSVRSRKRFVGCTNYSKGCRASAPLPQRGGIKATGKACPHCNWPIIDVFAGRGRPWRLCVNPKCPGKQAREERPAKPEPAVVREEG